METKLSRTVVRTERKPIPPTTTNNGTMGTPRNIAGRVQPLKSGSAADHDPAIPIENQQSRSASHNQATGYNLSAFTN